MSHEITPPSDNEEKEKIRKAKAMGTLVGLAFSDREASPYDVQEIMRYLPYIMRHKMGLWFSCWSPQDVIDYAEETGDGFIPHYEQAKRICYDLEGYDYLHSEVNEAVKEELRTLRNSGVNE